MSKTIVSGPPGSTLKLNQLLLDAQGALAEFEKVVRDVDAVIADQVDRFERLGYHASVETVLLIDKSTARRVRAELDRILEVTVQNTAAVSRR